MSVLQSKIKGSLYGFAIGDAMGATTEFMEKESIENKYGKVTDIIGGGWLHLKAGDVTDDTQMMLCVCEAIEYARDNSWVEDEEITMLDRCCENFVAWYKTNPPDIGGCCRRVIQNCMNHIDHNYWMNEAYDPNSLGNGSLMRTLPIILSGQSEDLAISQGRLTHNNETCDWSLLSYFRNMEEVLYNDTFLNSSLKPFSSNGHVINTLNNALYYVQHTMSLEDSIIMAVNEGGDADTIAAITGSLAGALYGYDSIPQRWIDQLSSDVKAYLNKYAKLFEKINEKVCTNTK